MFLSNLGKKRAYSVLFHAAATLARTFSTSIQPSYVLLGRNVLHTVKRKRVEVGQHSSKRRHLRGKRNSLVSSGSRVA